MREARGRPILGAKLPLAAHHSGAEKEPEPDTFFKGRRADGFLCCSMDEAQASLLASLPAQPPLFDSTAAQPSLWLIFSLSLCLSFLSQLPCPSLFPQKAPGSALGPWSFWPPLILTLIPVLPCLSACLSVSLYSQAPPGWPCAVQWGPLLSPHRGSCGEHGARGACQEAGDHGEAGRGKAHNVSPTLGGHL